MFEAWLHQHFPRPRPPRVEPGAETEAVALNDPHFHKPVQRQRRLRGSARPPLRRAARQHGLAERQEALDCSQFAVPPGVGGFAETQMSLF